MSNKFKDGHNIRISPRAWELLRWAKLEKDVKSYSDLIYIMEKSIEKKFEKQLVTYLENFEKSLHQVSSKEAKGSKTVLLSNNSRKLLEKIKVYSNEPAFTFSDAIEFLVINNKIKLPEKLQRN